MKVNNFKIMMMAEEAKEFMMMLELRNLETGMEIMVEGILMVEILEVGILVEGILVVVLIFEEVYYLLYYGPDHVQMTKVNCRLMKVNCNDLQLLTQI